MFNYLHFPSSSTISPTKSVSNDEFLEAGGEVPLTPTRSSCFTRYLFSFFQAQLALRKGFNQSEDAVISSVLCFNW